MERERYRLLMMAFDEACDLPPGERPLVVARLRQSDPELAEKLEDMLHHDGEDTAVFEPAAGARVLAIEVARQDEIAMPMSVLDVPGDPRAAGRVGAEVGPYRVGDCLGRGGSGTVYRAVDTRTSLPVAIKFLNRRALGDRRQRARFDGEFRAIAALRHPRCLMVFEQGESDLGSYFVMEYMAGGDLRRLVGADTGTLLGVLVGIAEALEHIHERGIVHRDLKPENVLLDDGTPPAPKLADFGIARVAGATFGTQTGTLVGSIDYVAPEQLRGRVDARSDLYGLGCLIHVLFRNKPPFEGDNFERLRARLSKAAPPLGPTAPEALGELTASLLAIDPAERPASAASVRQSLSLMLLTSTMPA
jgi:serine/threonine-protein kinase